MDLITVTRKGGLEFSIRVRAHELLSDMSEKDGGADRGPSPGELLAGSLGACISIMVQRYCERHGYTDGDVGVSMTVELTDNPKRVARFLVDLELPRDVPEEKRKAVLRVATACPVHETLKNPPAVDIEIV